MITRVNLLEKKRWQVTYGVLFGAIGGILVLSLSLYGFLWLTGVRAEKLRQTLQREIEQLKLQREQIIHQQSPLQGEGPLLQIQQALETAPPWSPLLNALTEALPPKVWLASLKSADQEIIINGQAKNAQLLTLFLNRLKKIPYLQKVVLTTSSEEPSGLFQFTISCAIGGKKWISVSPPNPENKF